MISYGKRLKRDNVFKILDIANIFGSLDSCFHMRAAKLASNSLEVLATAAREYESAPYLRWDGVLLIDISAIVAPAARLTVVFEEALANRCRNPLPERLYSSSRQKAHNPECGMETPRRNLRFDPVVWSEGAH